MKKNATTQQVFCGNNIELLREYPDNYFDAVVTDPPYGLGKEPNAEEMLRAWVTDGHLEVNGSGFMGKEWDAFVPQPIFWKEVFRVLKHGGHVVSFFGTRTYDWGVMAMRLSGFEIRDCIQWIYGSGFPKSHNISKAIDKMHGAEREVVGKSNYSMPKADNSMKENSYGISGGKLANGVTAERVIADVTIPTTPEAKKWDGWGTALKPANEPIVLARKPIEKGLNIAQNVIKWGTGALNIDTSRLEHNEEQKFTNRAQRKEGWNMDNCGFDSTKNVTASANPSGRFPTNVILTHHPDCKCIGLKDISNETEVLAEEWTCVDDCPIKVMDNQSGQLTSGKMLPEHTRHTDGSPNGIYGKFDSNHPITETYGDSGGASRFFYVAKASKSERNFGLDEFEEKQTLGGGGLTAEIKDDGSYETASAGGKYGSVKAKQRNTHPTVKPVKLMQYLVRLVTPENGIVLDPFNGSGTTGVACKIDGFNYVGMDLSEEYCRISQTRIDMFVEEREFIDECKIFDSQKNQIDGQTSIFDFID